MRHVYFAIGLIIINAARVGLSVYIDVPDFMLILLFIYAAVIGRVEGGIMALITGVIHDIIIGRVIGIHGLAYLLVVYFIGYLASFKMFSYNTPGLLVMLFGGSIFFEFIRWLLVELVFNIGIPLNIVFEISQLFLIIIQVAVGIIVFPWIQKYLKKSGYLFNY